VNQGRRSHYDQRDLAAVSVLALTALTAVALDLHPLLRVVLAVPLVLFLPGYAILSALAPARPLEAIERVLVSLGLSFAVTIVVGILLALTPVRLSALSWAITLAGLTLAGCAIAWVRRVRARIEGPRIPRLTSPPAAAALMLIAALIAGNALVGNSVGAVGQDEPAPEQLWMVPAASPGQIRLGMRAGPGGGEYALRLSSGGEVIQSYDLTLAEGEAWEQLVIVPEQAQGHALVARLYSATDGAELRFVFLQAPSP
jgi:hypothetical protein